MRDPADKKKPRAPLIAALTAVVVLVVVLLATGKDQSAKVRAGKTTPAASSIDTGRTEKLIDTELRKVRNYEADQAQLTPLPPPPQPPPPPPPPPPAIEPQGPTVDALPSNQPPPVAQPPADPF